MCVCVKRKRPGTASPHHDIVYTLLADNPRRIPTREHRQSMHHRSRQRASEQIIGPIIHVKVNVRAGDASHPGPQQERSRHNIVEPKDNHSDRQYNFLCCSKAAAARVLFEKKVDKTTLALRSLQGETGNLIKPREQAPPHDFVRGPKPNTPLMRDRLLDEIEISASTINCTTIDGNNDNPTAIPGITGIQEHKTPDYFHGSLTKQFRKQYKALQCGPPCTKSRHSAAGVGIKNDICLLTAEPDITTTTFKKWYDNGRLIQTAVIISQDVSFTVDCCYGHVGGRTDTNAARCTSLLFEAIYHERVANGKGPAIILTDLNANPEDIRFLGDMFIGAEKWIDV